MADFITQPLLQLLKERLLISHQLTTVQMAEKILDMLELGDCRPSKLLAAMMEFCPEGEVNSAFFRASFLCRLPREIRVLLADEVIGNLKYIVVRADKLFQHHRPNIVAVVDTAVDEDLAEVVFPQEEEGGHCSRCWRRSKSSFICDCHWNYGAKAFQCDAPNKCQ